MSNGTVVYGPKDKKIYILDNLTKFSLSVFKGVTFFHAFTGCDAVSSFYKVWKATFWAILLAKVKAGDTPLSNIFKKFSNCPMDIKVNEFHKLCNFVSEAFGLTKQAPFKKWWTDHLISMPNVNLRMLVPSASGIVQHIKRACIQAGYFWKLSEIETNMTNPIEWGWKPLHDGSFVPHWQNEAVTDNIKPIIGTCSCSTGECSNCSC